MAALAGCSAGQRRRGKAVLVAVQGGGALLPAAGAAISLREVAEAPATLQRLSEDALGKKGSRKEEGDDRSGPHVSMVVGGVFQAIRKYDGLQVGPRTSNT